MKQLFFLFAVGLAIALSFGAAPPVECPPEKKQAPLLTFVFDDGNSTDYLIAREIFKRKGATASFAVVTGWIGKDNCLSVSQLLELQDEGFEIMSHTVSHPDLKRLSAEQVEFELSVSKASLEGLGIRVNNLVYPYNRSNEMVRKLAGRYFRSARGRGSALNSIDLDGCRLTSFRSGRNVKRMKSLIDRAYKERKWLILYHHNIDVKVVVSGKKGSFLPGEDLVFLPSGATGRHSNEISAYFYYESVTGVPEVGDTITGRSSGAACRLIRRVYDWEKILEDLLSYASEKYPDLRIVTVDQGLDIYQIK